MGLRTEDQSEQIRTDLERTVTEQRTTIDDLRFQLDQKARLIDTLQGQLATAASDSEVDRQTRFAALNLMEDAIQARLAEERENVVRRSMEEELRHADRRKDEFLATLAHELRTPLSPIRNSLYILRLAEYDKPTVDRVCATMERQVNLMVRLVDDLMEVSRITRGRIELRKELCDLATIIHEAVDSCRPQLEQARHQLTISIAAVPLLVDADRIRMTQVITNLLSNSTKYTNDGGQIWVTAARDENSVRIVIGDTGLGVPQEMLGKIFDLFTQLHSTSSRSQGGLGIGLALVRSLIDMHGGTIEAQSQGLGHGTEFIIRLPLASTSAEDFGLPTTLPNSFAFTGSVLVVDDSSDAATSLGTLLTALGAKAQVANDGPSAIRHCEIHTPSVIICDIGMPMMDGYEVARNIRRIPKCKHVLLIALTGWGQAVDRRRSHEAGFDHHLVKPVEIGALKALLSSINQPNAQNVANLD